MSAEPVEPLSVPAPEASPVAAGPIRRGRAILALVPTPVRARRAPFVALVLVLLAGGLVGLLLLNTASAQDAFRLHALQNQAAALAQENDALTSSTDGLDDPARLAARAAQLGLEPGGVPVFLKPGEALPPGAIRMGNLAYVPGIAPPPAPTPTPAAKVTVKPSAAASKPVAKSTLKPTVKSTVKAPVATAPGVKAPAVKAPAATTPVKVPAQTPVAKVTKAPVAKAATPTTAKATIPAATKTQPVAGQTKTGGGQ